MQVIASPGLRVPIENKPRHYITDDKPDDVPDTAYYRRALESGDLLQYEPPAKVRKEKTE